MIAIERARWWLAAVFASWMLRLMRKEMSDDQVLRFEQFARTFAEHNLELAALEFEVAGAKHERIHDVV
jgi:hypothetical protein